DERDRQELDDQHPRHRSRRSGQIEEQRVDRDRVEPVAELRDRLADEQQSEIAVAAEEREGNVHAMPVRIIVGNRCPSRSRTTEFSSGPLRAGWARSTARATRASAARSRSRSSPPRSPAIRIAASGSCVKRAPPPRSRIRTSPPSSKSAKTRDSS